MTDSPVANLSHVFMIGSKDPKAEPEAGTATDFAHLEGRVVHLKEVAELAGQVAREVNGPVLGTLQQAFWDFPRHVTEVYERAAKDIPTWYPYGEMPKGQSIYYDMGMNLRNEQLSDLRDITHVDARKLCKAIADSSLPPFEKRVLFAAAGKAFDHGRRARLTGQLYDRDNPPQFTAEQVMRGSIPTRWTR